MAVTVAEFFKDWDEGFTEDQKLRLADRRLLDLRDERHDIEERSREMPLFANCCETDTKDMP